MMNGCESLLPWVIVPALAVALFGQLLVQVIVGRATRASSRLSGYAVARQILDGSGLYDVEVAQVPGHLSDHFDVRRRVVQLSPDVYHGRHLAAAGIAAHEAGHAIQAAKGCRRSLAVREAAVPAAGFGSGAGILLAIVGLVGQFPPFLSLGILIFGAAVALQLLNLPIELHASACAAGMVRQLQLVTDDELPRLRRVMFAAAWTYVGATLQSIWTLVQYAANALNRRRGDE
jgi:Zn-dependent membrane protease YugP